VQRNPLFDHRGDILAPSAAVEDAVVAASKKYFMAKDVGHYGIFNGRRWRENIAPVVEKWVSLHS